MRFVATAVLTFERFRLTGFSRLADRYATDEIAPSRSCIRPAIPPGGIALWERKTGTLLSGDIIYDGPLIDDCYHSDLGDYETSLRRLAKLPARAVHGGHFPSFGHKRLIEVIDEYLLGRRLPGCHLDT